MKKNVNELATLKRRLADLEQHNQKLQLENEALVTMINLAEQQFKIPIRKSLVPNSKPFKHPASIGWYAKTLRPVWEKPSGLV
ncbi:hypothetical protein [Dyadobacter fermentans]|uniref:hypothetical protein n=1 Tax=Dyadobacter fermentans TaxID=94254 RepID=UPI001CBB8452|nr:hypothetical protein [Dyadobacter fermentans]MBZ1363047.1 hypothetical protein [Dyadobacter fermentans]